MITTLNAYFSTSIDIAAEHLVDPTYVIVAWGMCVLAAFGLYAELTGADISWFKYGGGA